MKIKNKKIKKPLEEKGDSPAASKPAAAGLEWRGSPAQGQERTAGHDLVPIPEHVDMAWQHGGQMPDISSANNPRQDTGTTRNVAVLLLAASLLQYPVCSYRCVEACHHVCACAFSLHAKCFRKPFVLVSRCRSTHVLGLGVSSCMTRTEILIERVYD